jgi:hypothetical protein
MIRRWIQRRLARREEKHVAAEQEVEEQMRGLDRFTRKQEARAKPRHDEESAGTEPGDSRAGGA